MIVHGGVGENSSCDMDERTMKLLDALELCMNNGATWFGKLWQVSAGLDGWCNSAIDDAYPSDSTQWNR